MSATPMPVGLAAGQYRTVRYASSAALALCLALELLVFRGRLLDLALQNHSAEYFVLAVSFLLLLLRARHAVLADRLDLVGPLLIFAALATCIAMDAWRRPIFSSTPLLFAVCTFGIVWTLFGAREARRQLFPSAYLLLMTPIPVLLVVNIDMPLQILSARLGCLTAQALGIATIRSGTTIGLHGSELSLRIIGDCSGLRSAFAMLVVSILLGWLLKASYAKRVVLVCFGVLVAYATNIVRITSILALLNHYGQSFVNSLPTFEEYFGALLFALSIAALFFFARRLGCRTFREI